MAKVTSKLQVTVPKSLSDQFGIRPGDDLQWVAAGDTIRVVPPTKGAPLIEIPARLALFDRATQRQRQRNRRRRAIKAGRGWTREQLYERG